MEKLIYGQGGGGGGESSSSSTGTEYPDSLSSKSYIRAIDLLGEGEFEEVLVGGYAGLLLNDIPVMNQDGTYNFTGINIETRSGSLSQPRMSAGNTTESTTSVGVEMRYNTPVEASVQSVDTDIIRVNVRVPSLTFTNVSNGDVTGTSVSYKIEWKDSISSVWNAVDGRVNSYNTPVASGEGSVSFSGWVLYTYNVSITTCMRTAGDDYNTTTLGITTYELQYRINGGGWITLNSGQISSPTPTPFSANITTASANDLIGIRAILTDFTAEGPANIPSVATIGVGGIHSAVTSEQVISGKASSEYERQTSFRVHGTAPWIVRVTRITPDSTSAYLSNKTYFSSITTVLEERLRYPGSVLVGGTYDAEQFSSVPSRSFLCKCLRVKVPTNYNPITRTYSGFWDGSFKVAWTDNPAWCFYDLLTNTRYGLGERIPESFIDKWELYSISQYCDEMVPGYGNILEPRFTCNIAIQTKEEAYKVISDFASIFRGLTYWGGGSIVPVQDRPRDVAYAFNNTNVVDGVFTYQSSAIGTRYNVVNVTWNNPNNFYKREVEYVEDHDLIESLGYINEYSVVGFGCSSRGMARRIGRWLIYTNNYQTDVVSFTTGVEGAIPRPGDVIKISDTLRSQDRRGGRVVSSTLSGAVLDKPLSFTSGVEYIFSGIDNDGKLVETDFAATGTTDNITFTNDLPNALSEDSIYIVSDNNIEAQQFKVVSITDKGEGKYEVNAVSHNPSKYAYIESNIPLIDFALPATTTIPVSNIDFNEYLYVSGVSVLNRCDISWSAPQYAKKYIVTILNPDKTVTKHTTETTSHYILDAKEGNYEVSVTAINILGQQAQTYKQTILSYGKTKVPAAVPNFAVNAVGGKAQLTWDTHPDLDVVVGGYVLITHSTKTIGASWEDGITVGQVAGGNTSALVPLLGGTYMAKAIDSSGFYSTNAAFAYADYALVQNTNVIDTIEEAPLFSGIKTNMVVEGGSLTLDRSVYIDDVVDIDSLPEIDWLGGGVHTEGEYLFSRVIDLSSSYNVNISGSIAARSFELFAMMDDRTDLIDSWVNFDSFISNTFVAKTMISTTNDDPSSPSAVWSDWSEFKIATYSGRGFKFKLYAQVVSDLYNILIDELSISVDVDDRVVGENDIVCGSSGLDVTFTPNFMLIPAISVSINDQLQGDYYEVTSKTAGGFHLVVKDSTGTPVSRVIDYIAKGYGYKVV